MYVTLPILVAAPREGGVRTIETLVGPAGRLEALLNASRLPQVPSSAAPLAAVVLCHPHPLFGGTMHNKVVYHAMKTFTELNLPVLRFNFRGTARSQGQHDHGRGEQDDVRSAVNWITEEYGLPVLAAGFSFGAHMALRAGCNDSRVAGLVSLGTPIEAANRVYSYEFLHECAKPKLFLSGTADAFGPVDKLQEALTLVPEPKQVAWVAEADHFFAGKLDTMQGALESWLLTHFLPELAARVLPQGLAL